LIAKTKPLKVLIIGSGGREHALAWKAAQSPKVQKVWVAPGNAGTELEPKVQNIALAVDDADGLVKFAQSQEIDLTIIGPEAALDAGVSDRFLENGLACFGPSQQAARLEISKIFSKQFMQAHSIPTAAYETFTDEEQAIAYVHKQSLPIVIKADGLAAGKGVIIAQTLIEAEEAIHAMLTEKIFGQAGQSIVIEEFLQGVEMSYIVMTDGKTILPLASSKDHKRRDDYDQGPNTGGMGAYSPAPQITPDLEQRILKDVISPVIKGFEIIGIPYTGFLYAGLMITSGGEIKVLEFNCRLGDPETQAILMRLQSDLVELCHAAVQGKLDQVKASWDPRPALTVVLTAAGYPGNYQTGDCISSIMQTATDCKVFHAATQKINQEITTNGGRVLGVTALGVDLIEARNQAYSLVEKIAWPGAHYRTDIGA